MVSMEEIQEIKLIAQKVLNLVQDTKMDNKERFFLHSIHADLVEFAENKTLELYKTDFQATINFLKGVK